MFRAIREPNPRSKWFHCQRQLPATLNLNRTRPASPAMRSQWRAEAFVDPGPEDHKQVEDGPAHPLLPCL